MARSVHHRVGLHEVDAAGVMFAASICTLAHTAYETALLEVGLDLAELVRAGPVHLPMRRLAADFRGPIRHGDRLVCSVAVDDLGDDAYTCSVALIAEPDRRRMQGMRALITQQHVCIDPDDHCTRPLPDAIRAALSRLGPRSGSAP